jgi:two-component system sensor histidine kinase UhpB
MKTREAIAKNPRTIAVLLIEDDPDYRTLVERWLTSSREAQFGVRSAARLDDAWNRIAVSDVIVLDLGLPDADGLETLVAARELAGNAPIVVLTGSDDADIGQRVLRAGADGFVSKRRADPAILHAVLRRAIAARAHARDQARVQRAVVPIQPYSGEGPAGS